VPAVRTVPDDGEEGLKERLRPTRSQLKSALTAATLSEERRTLAFAVCVALEEAYAKVGEGGSVDWSDLDMARELAQEALGEEEVARIGALYDDANDDSLSP